MPKSLFVLQGGGPTAVINATLAGLLESARPLYDAIWGLPHSFEGMDSGEVVDLRRIQSSAHLERLAQLPGAFLGSSRKKAGVADFDRILKQMRAAGSDTLVGIGGNGTMNTLAQFAAFAESQGMWINVCGLPKTVDNDLHHVHVSPGYGSAARFVAIAVRDFGYDFRSMATFDDVTILETMGRETGWLAAASSALKVHPEDPPHIVLVPERPFDEKMLLDDVARQHSERGHVFIVVNEMLRTDQGVLVGADFQNGPLDDLGRRMYSLSLGTGNYLADLIWRRLQLQTRCLRPGNLGRALTACVSEPDRLLARKLGRDAASAIWSEESAGQMVTIDESLKFGWHPLIDCGGTRFLPSNFMMPREYAVSEEFIDYARPLIGAVEPLIIL